MSTKTSGMELKFAGVPLRPNNSRKKIFSAFSIVMPILIFLCSGCTPVKNKNQMVRIAKLVIDSAQLESYKAALKEEIETSLRVEPGVLTLYAVSEKENPTHITILEIYADSSAYKAHLQTPHFMNYKTGTKDMVTSLELVEVEPLIPGFFRSMSKN